MYVLTVTVALPLLTAVNLPVQLVFVILTTLLLSDLKTRFAHPVPSGIIELSCAASPTLIVRLVLLMRTEPGAFLTVILQDFSRPFSRKIVKNQQKLDKNFVESAL